MAPPPVLFAHPSSLEHDTGGHPEQASRIVAVMAELARRDWLGYERVESPPVSREVLERVHSARYVDAIEQAAAAGGGYLDADTVLSRGSFEAAMHGSGGAVAMVERLLSGGAGTVGFSAHRPPGHHALPDRAMGFCLFNNVAVAARSALDQGGLERVLVLDWDVHHGNGTNDVFTADPNVLFVSVHQWPLYPGTGAASDLGTGAGRGFTVNIPVAPGSGDEIYVPVVRDLVVPLGRCFEPELILISAGFDAHRDDPLADCAVSEAGFAEMARLMRGLADGLKVPVGAVLEGGYAVDALARSVAATMQALVEAPPGGTGDAASSRGELVAPVRQALDRLAEFWPGLA